LTPFIPTVALHDHPGRAEPALERVVVVERLLDGVQRPVTGEALDGGHLAAVGLHGEHRARLHALPVEVHRACTAVAGVASHDGAGLAEALPQVVDEQRAGLDIVGVVHAVDGDPYPVVDQKSGHIVWIVDGYTTMANYPYSERQSLAKITGTSLRQGQKDTQINYIRNSVKATVDAYTGKVTLYQWDTQDPVLKTWRKIFPNLIQPAHINLGLAIDMQKPDGTRQLLVPSIKAAEKMDFAAFWTAYEDIVRKARDNKLTVEDFQGTTISLTNPGTIGTNHSVPRLMRGQGAIIGVGAMEYPPEWQGASEEAIARNAISKVMTLTSTYDHRVIQGAQSGDFLKRLHQLLLGEDGFYDEIFQALRIPYEPVRWIQDHDKVRNRKIYKLKKQNYKMIKIVKKICKNLKLYKKIIQLSSILIINSI